MTTDNKPSPTPEKDVADKCAEEMEAYYAGIDQQERQGNFTIRSKRLAGASAIIRKYIPVWTRIEKDKAETLPPDFSTVLAYDGGAFVATRLPHRRHDDRMEFAWYRHGTHVTGVTHWAPIPAAPEEK